MRYLTVVFVTVSVWVTTSHAADVSYNAEIQLETPRKNPPRMGGPLDKVELKIWIPEGVSRLQGAIVNPYYTETVGQKHWQAAARLWNFAIIGANYFGVKQNEFGPTLQSALDDFARQSKHPELKEIPFCFVGMSAGAGMCMRMAQYFPDRTIACAPVCLEVGPSNAETRSVPTVTIFGERDGKQYEKLTSRLPNEIKEGARWAIAVQWRRRHEFGQANNLAMVFFDRVIRARKSKEAGNLKLRSALSLRADGVWLGFPDTWSTDIPKIAPAKKSEPTDFNVCWFPDSYTAHVWQAFVAKSQPIKIASPAGLGDKQPFKVHKPGKLKVAFKGVAKNAERIHIMDGDRIIAKGGPSESSFEVNVDQGIHALIVIAELSDGRRLTSRPHTIVVADK